MKLFRTLKNLYLRECHRIASDVMLFTMLVLAPLAYLTIYGFAYINKKEVNVPILVIDQDKSAFSRQLIRSLDAHQIIAVNGIEDNREEALRLVNRGDISAVILIPDHFESNVRSGRASWLRMYVNSTRFLPSSDLSKAVNEVVATLATGIKLRFFQTRGYSYEQARELSQPLNGDIRNLFNPADTYGEFLLPGLMILIIHQILLISFMIAMVGEKEDLCVGKLLNAAHGRAWLALKGKASIYLVLFCLYVPLIYGLNFRLFNLHIQGNFWLIWGLIVLAIGSVLALGAALTLFFQTRLGVFQILAFTSYPIFFISGYSWPFASLPLPLQWLGNLLPIKPFLAAYSRSAMMGAGFYDIQPEIVHLLILTVVYSLIGSWQIKKMAKAEQNQLHLNQS